MEPLATSEIKQFELRKAQLECEKIEAEIRSINSPWWKKAGYIGSLSPIIIALIGVFTAFWTGFFNSERAKLRLDIRSLEAQKSKLELEMGEIQTQIDEAYLSINRGIAELGYAANHIQACQPISESEMERFRTSPNIKYSTKTVSKLIDCHQNIYTLIPIINEEIQRAKLRLDAIPASSGVKSLKPQIGPGN